MLYLVFHYSQAIRNCPGSLSLRRWTPQAKWLFREYNELPHVFSERIAKSYEYSNFYMNLFPGGLIQPFLKIISFLCGAALTIFFIIGLLTDSGYLLTIEIFGNKSLAWLMSLVGAVYGICKVSIVSDIQPYSADECLEEVEKHIHYDFRDKQNSAHSWEAFEKFADFFQPIVRQLGIELFSVLLNPFLFTVIMPKKSEVIVNFVMQNSVQAQGVGWICAFSAFEGGQQTVVGEQDAQMRRSITSFGEFEAVPLLEFRDGTEWGDLSVGGVARPESPLIRIDFNSADMVHEFQGD
jgi:autophagy-related protein 9